MSSIKLRPWQAEAINKCKNWFLAENNKRFLINAAPGSGKTICATVMAKELIEKNHKTFDAFKKEMLRMAMSIQGSGWVYLARNGSIKKTPNQSYKTDILMPIDMWEHSFTDYIPAKDAKGKYIKAMMTIIDWNQINMRMGK